MELKKVDIKNKGMEQDTSISKSSQEFAFENHNIRIISNDDCTSMSITNLQGPSKVENIQLKGIVLGKCVLDKYIVIFTHEIIYNSPYNISEHNCIDRIYRINLDTFNNLTQISCNILFEGNLNLHEDYPIDAIYYMENVNIIKVYWTDGLNNPRFINIITEGERELNDNKVFTPYTDASIFDFYPVINKIPTIELSKVYDFNSELPNGVIQYFVTYYNTNGAETLIASSSAPITTDFMDRGAKADDPAGRCCVEISISNLDTKFDCVRIYSATRTIEQGELIVKIVKDLKIEGDTPIKIIDNGIDQETLSPAQLFYIGGQPLIAKTLTQKDGTLFLGNLRKENVFIPDTVYESINNTIKEFNQAQENLTENSNIYNTYDPYNINSSDILVKSPFVSFNQTKKVFTYDSKNNIYYPYVRQTLQDISKYKTFKSNEIYRFGIQFQSIKGEWSEVLWIGDVECEKRPVINDDGSVELNNAFLDSSKLFTDDILNALNDAGLKSYRLVIADPVKHNGRKIKAQGVLCPTLFNVRERYLGKYANASWIMRPRNIKASYHHLEPLVDYTSEGAEVVTNYTTEYPNITYDVQKPPKKTYVGITYIPSFEKKCVYVKYVEFESKYALNCGYDFFGTPDITIVKDYYVKDDTGLTNLLKYVSEEEKVKIPSEAFKEMYNQQSKQFALKLIIATVMVVVTVLAGIYGGTLLAGALSTFLTSMSASAPVLLSGLLVTALATSGAVANTLSIPDSVYVTPNLSDSQVKELIGEKYDELPNYYKEFIKKGCVQRPVQGNTKMDNIYGTPTASKIESVFSETQVKYPGIYYEDGQEKRLDFKVSTLPIDFKPDSIDNGDYVFFQLYEKDQIYGVELNVSNDYFIDESVLTFHSPEITEDSIINSNYKCNIIGYVPLENYNYVKAQFEMDPAPYGELGGLNSEYLASINTDINNYTPFYSGDLYKDVSIANENVYKGYKCFLFGPTNLIGYPTEQNEGGKKSLLKKKQVLNHSYSKGTVYFENSTNIVYDSSTALFKEDSLFLTDINDVFPTAIYEGNYSNAYIVKNMKHLSSNITETNDSTESDEMINISFNSTPHIVLNLKPSQQNTGRIPLLPIVGKQNPDRYLSIRDNRISNTSKWQHNALTGDKAILWDNTLVNSGEYTEVDYYHCVGDSNVSIYESHTSRTSGSGDSQDSSSTTDSEDRRSPDPSFDSMNRGSSTTRGGDSSTTRGGRTTTQGSGSRTDRGPTTTSEDSPRTTYFDIKKHFADSNVWKDLSAYKAFGVNFITTKYKDNYDTVAKASTFNGVIKSFYNTPLYAGGSLPSWQLLYYFDTINDSVYDTSITYSTSSIHKHSKEDLYGFYSYIFSFIGMKFGVGASYSFNHYYATPAYFLLGLLLYFNSYDNVIETYETNSRLTTHYEYIIPSCIKDKNAFILKMDEFQKYFKELFVYCIGYKQIAKVNEKIETEISKNIKTAFDKVCTVLDSIGNMHPEFKELVDTCGDFNSAQELLSDYLFLKVYQKEKLERISYLTLMYKDNAGNITGYVSPKDLITRIKYGIEEGYKKFISMEEHYESCINWQYNIDSGNIFSIDYDNEGNAILIEGYDNSKGFLRYEGTLWEYKDGKLVKPSSNSSIDLYYQDEIDHPIPNKPYLMMAELYSDIPYSELYGGYTEKAIKKLTWFPVSGTYPIGMSIDKTFGDTYYQRWDCLKTYPSTEEDVNQNVDITSFMVESHINLDNRTDKNRGKFNIMTRPTNFNLFNNVYNNNNDIFVYQTKISDFVTNYYPNQFVWTLNKNYMGDVDSWTNASFLAVNQCQYPITKLCNYRDKVFSLTSKSLEYIDFNTKNFIPTNDGFIEIQNNSKVSNVVSVSNTLGSNNSSIQITEKGLYFVEDNEGTIIRINTDGSTFRIGTAKMDSWLHKHINVGDYSYSNQHNIHLEYDSINKDLYILNNEYCLVYNELLESFTSFVDLQETLFLFSYNSKLWSIAHLENSNLYEMYAGDYNCAYDNQKVGYSLHYRVSPGTDMDNVFTNINFVADINVNDSNSLKANIQPFDTIRVWTEYQDSGVKPLVYTMNRPSNLKQKFRMWRADIPRDANSKWGRDRIRNPWVHLVISKDANESNTHKMEMHNLEIQYMS